MSQGSESERIHFVLSRVIPYLTRVEDLAGIKARSESFALVMTQIMSSASAASDDPMLPKGAKKAARLARQLKAALHNPDLSRRLEFYDPDALSDLAEQLHKLEQDKKGGRPKQWAETIRKDFVNSLLDAVHDAGGNLGLDRRNGGGSLVDVINELQPHLPDLFKYGLSEATLRQIKTAWLKSRKNRSKKRKHWPTSLSP